MESAPPARVLVVEDDDTVRSGLAASLRSHGYTVHPDPAGQDIEVTLDRFRPDLIIMDVRLPGEDGFALARRVRAMSEVPLLFLTAADRIEDRLTGFETGGDDYVVKPFAMTELLARVQALLRRTGRGVAEVREIGDLIIDERNRLALRAGRQLDLTPTEFDLLAVLANNVGEVLSKSRLLALVWEFEEYDDNLVEVHISSLRKKLERWGPRLIRTVRGAGYVLRP